MTRMPDAVEMDVVAGPGAEQEPGGRLEVPAP